MDAKLGESLTDDVKEYYGKTLQSAADLKTNACCPGSSKPPQHVADAMRLVHEDVSSRYYGCGLVVPEHLEGTHILDLGSGAGYDCYVLSKLVGEDGHVTGVDMTDEQLDVARKYVDHHTQAFGYKKPNIDFRKGYLEKLAEAGLQKNYYDMVISNCVINLCKDKAVVLEETFNVLKEGGELYFSDVYSDRIVPDDVRQNKLLWGECISGALWWEELYQLAQDAGFSEPRLVRASPVTIGNPEVQKILGDLQFLSVTYRLFKLPSSQSDPCNVMYDGEITGHPDSFSLDHCHTFHKDDVVCVDGDVAAILKTSRFSDDFTFQSADKKRCCSDANKPNKINPFDWLKDNATTDSSAQSCCPPNSGSSTSCCAPTVTTKCC